MSLIDKALAAVTPQPDDETRKAATEKARAASKAGDWLSLVLDHHDAIRAAFASGRAAKTAVERNAACDALAVVLDGHALAEELVKGISLPAQLAAAGGDGPLAGCTARLARRGAAGRHRRPL